MARRIVTASLRTYVAVSIFVGLVLGFLIGTWSRNFMVSCSWGPGGQICCGPRMNRDYPMTVEDWNQEDQDAPDVDLLEDGQSQGPGKNLVFIGVMTARKYITTRIVAVYNTWAKTIPGQVMFFSSEGSENDAPPGVPVVGLPGVDDTYPPQKKSFLMLKFIHDNFIDDYEWFMRVDDDAYIKGDKLAEFLHSINSSKPQFIGQAGLGTKDEIGKLSLSEDQNFCMGGPGMVFSRTTLQLVTPHISYCLKNLYSTHEDVEIGRCVGKFSGASCSWAFEMQQLFYQNHIEPQGSFNHSLKIKQVHKAITLHPVKNHTYQFRLHSYFYKKKALEARHKTIQLHREVAQMTELLSDENMPANSYSLPVSLMKYTPTTREEVIPWVYLSKYIYSHTNSNPRRGLEPHFKNALNDIMMQVMMIINKNARQRGRTIDFKEILYGYHRYNPLHGADYVLDLLLIYRKHKGRRLTVPVRRHAYIQQTFSDVEFDEYLPLVNGDASINPSTPGGDRSGGFLAMVQKGFNQFSNFYRTGAKDNLGLGPLSSFTPDDVIHFILPLAGRYSVFLRFMANFEEVCLKNNEKVAIVIVLFKSEIDDKTLETVNFVSNMKSKYPNHMIRVLHAEGTFSRGKALALGTSIFPEDTLLFFIDVDILYNRDSLQRIRRNTVINKKVYYPIVFSQYDPSTYCTSDKCQEDPFSFSQEAGYWRQFGFGIACMYKKDYLKVGGFDTNIQGWGKEDVDLFEKFVNSSLRIFRSVDPGMTHIFHSILCDPNLESAQYMMCLGTKAASYGAINKMAERVYKVPAILQRNQGPNEDENKVLPEVLDDRSRDQALAEDDSPQQEVDARR